ncbi:MAG: DUF7178 family protein, partial [Desulfobulbia bacterium]
MYNKTSDDQRDDWYQEANDLSYALSVAYDVPLAKVIGIVSALSPMKLWSQNIKLAEDILKGIRVGHT